MSAWTAGVGPGVGEGLGVGVDLESVWVMALLEDSERFACRLAERCVAVRNLPKKSRGSHRVVSSVARLLSGNISI